MELSTEKEFDDAISQKKTVVEVFANWCPDCKRIEPLLEGWADTFSSGFQLLRINRDSVPEVAERYEVMGIPSFLVFENGELQKRLLSRDAKSAKQVEEFLKTV